MIPHTVTIGNGEQFRIPGGNMLWVYSLGATSGVTAKFYAPDGKQIGTEWTLVQGIKYGPGQSRPDGSFWFQWADIFNNSGAAQTITVYTLESTVDLSGASSGVSISDTFLDSSTRQGMLELQRSLSPDTGNLLHESVDFAAYHFFGALAVNDTLALYFMATEGGDGFYPHQIYIDRVEYQCGDVAAMGVDPDVLPTSTSPYNTASYVAGAQLMAFNGGDNQRIFPQDNGGSTRRWVQQKNITGTTVSIDKSVDCYRTTAGEKRVWEPPVPLCVADYSTSTTYGVRGVYLSNLGSSATYAWLRVYGRVVPTSTGWTS